MSSRHRNRFAAHHHPLKRLNQKHHSHLHAFSKIPSGFIEQNVVHQPMKYRKYFNYPLNELLANHSTDPNQNTTTVNASAKTDSKEGRFANHHMTIHRDGITTILRPKPDLVQSTGFTPKRRSESLVPSPPSMVPHRPQSASNSIMNKMAMTKTKQKKCVKEKRQHSEVSFEPMMMENYPNDIDERWTPSSYHNIDPSYDFHTHLSSHSDAMFPPPHRPPLLPVPDENRFEDRSLPYTSFYEPISRFTPSLPSMRQYPEYSFDYCREEYRHCSSEQKFYTNYHQLQDPYRFDYFTECPEMIHRSDYFF